MIAKDQEKERAVSLRKEGYSYNEILKIVPVAKSTLSLWLREVGLSKQHKQRLTEKRLVAARKGGLAKRQWRVRLEKSIKEKALQDIVGISEYELLILGTALYWAEGSKQKEHLVSVGVIFSNSDISMVRVFMRYLKDICKIEEDEIYFEISIHETADYKAIQQWWSSELNVSIEKLQRVYFKKNSIKRSYRKNRNEDYHGQLRIIVRNSTNLNRKISGWTNGIIKEALKY